MLSYLFRRTNTILTSGIIFSCPTQTVIHRGLHMNDGLPLIQNLEAAMFSRDTRGQHCTTVPGLQCWDLSPNLFPPSYQSSLLWPDFVSLKTSPFLLSPTFPLWSPGSLFLSTKTDSPVISEFSKRWIHPVPDLRPPMLCLQVPAAH